MKIAITGAAGMLGVDLLKVLSKKHKVTGICHTKKVSKFPCVHSDITNTTKIIKDIVSLKPDLVIHSAAYPDVDGCELNPDYAYKVNAIGTQNIALACQKVSASMLYISTDYVYDGTKKQPYIEFDSVNPLSVYGKSKLAGEWYVSSILNKFYIVRTAFLFGENGNNFIKAILKNAKENDKLKVVTDLTGSPTYTVDLAQEIARLIETEYYGIYHITNKGFCSRYELAKKILEQKGIKKQVIPSTTKTIKRPASRPKFSALRNFCLELTIGNKMQSWEQALATYLKKI